MLHQMYRRLRDQQGQSMSEYALLVALLAIFGVVALLILGPEIQAVFEEIRDYLQMRP